jgi:hypothetical protein
MHRAMHRDVLFFAYSVVPRLKSPEQRYTVLLLAHFYEPTKDSGGLA